MAFLEQCIHPVGHLFGGGHHLHLSGCLVLLLGLLTQQSADSSLVPGWRATWRRWLWLLIDAQRGEARTALALLGPASPPCWIAVVSLMDIVSWGDGLPQRCLGWQCAGTRSTIVSRHPQRCSSVGMGVSALDASQAIDQSRIHPCGSSPGSLGASAALPLADSYRERRALILAKITSLGWQAGGLHQIGNGNEDSLAMAKARLPGLVVEKLAVLMLLVRLLVVFPRPTWRFCTRCRAVQAAANRPDALGSRVVLLGLLPQGLALMPLARRPGLGSHGMAVD